MTSTVTQSILCDGCGKELVVDSKYPSNYILELHSINSGINTSNITYAIHLEPQLKKPVHFCGYDCLKDWLKFG